MTNEPEKPHDLMTRKEVAEACRVHVESIKRWGRAGRLNPITISTRVVRYRRIEVESLLRGER